VCCGSGQAVCGGACCAGSTCCGTACATEHANGAGGWYYDCNPLATYTEAAARAAALSWAPDGVRTTSSDACPYPSCLSWTNGGACGVWCWGATTSDALRGLMAITSGCSCPYNGGATWQ
jgi:hypothetical protein